MRLPWIVRTRAMPKRTFLGLKQQEVIYSTVIILVIAVFSLAVNLQGWKSRIPAFDLLTYIHGVHDFIETGAILQHGDTGSYGSYKPPGTAWLMLPSALLFDDPRLSEYVGTGLLHIATLAGLFLLARIFFGFPCAVLATLLYGLSEHSYFLAGSLWPNGRPDFYIWVVLFTSLWVLRREGKYFGAAIAVWGIGMHVDMGITPAFFILPVAWLIYKPPLHVKPILFAVVVVLIIWSPYLKFEIPRGFADIRSQLLQQQVIWNNHRATWCDQNRSLQQFTDFSKTDQGDLVLTNGANSLNPGLLLLLRNEWNAMKEKVLSNFQVIAPISGAPFTLLLLTFCSLLFWSLPGAADTRTHRPFWRQGINLFAVGFILCGLIISFFLLLRLIYGEGSGAGPKILLLYKLRKILLLSGMTLLFGYWMVNKTHQQLLRFGVPIPSSEQKEPHILLVISLLIPWFLLLVLAEPGKPERFWWLWPMQSLFLAAFFTNVLPHFPISRKINWIGQVAVVLLVAANPFLFSRINAWARTGWAGEDADEILVVDYIAHQMQAKGQTQAAIGYQTFIYPFMAEYNITNPIYKVGAEFDMLLLYRHSIKNTNQCAEGISNKDEYRVVETKPKAPDWSPKSYFEGRLNEQFQLGKQIKSYEVYQHVRDP